jgi:hypothetical protein
MAYNNKEKKKEKRLEEDYFRAHIKCTNYRFTIETIVIGSSRREVASAGSSATEHTVGRKL